MKNFRKIISAVLTVALVFSLNITNVYAEDIENEVETASQVVENVSQDIVSDDSNQEITATVGSGSADEDVAPVAMDAQEVETCVESEGGAVADEVSSQEESSSDDVFVGEQAAATNEKSSEVSSSVDDSNPNGSSVAVSSIYNSGTNLSGAYKAKTDNTDNTGNGNLTILLRGLTENNKQVTFDAINSRIGQILSSDYFALTSEADIDQFIDADKYNLQNANYDANHCWAATASNILWTTGYAKETINPITGRLFTSEDEVMSYFSENFTDYAGDPNAGVEWFMNGKYRLNNIPNVAHTKSEGKGGLHPDNGLQSKSALVEVFGNSNAINMLDSIGAYGMGLLVRWVEEGNKLSENAHWMTAVGTIVNQAAQNIVDKYKAIIIANSDDKPANGPLSANYATKLAAKSSRPNQYVIYKLNYNNEDDVWYLNGLGDSPAVITYLYELIDKDKTPQGGDEPNDDYNSDIFNSNIVVQDPEDPNALYIVIPQAEENQNNNEANVNVANISETAEVEKKVDIVDINSFRALTVSQLELEENINELQNYMVNNLIPIFSLSNGVVKENESYEAYITAPETFIYGVSIDGVDVPFNQYEMVSTKSGLSKIIIKNTYLMKLLKGKHKLLIRVQNIDIPVEVELVIE